MPILQGVKLSKTQNTTIAKIEKRMKVIPYASAIGYIKYAMLCTRPIVYLAMSLEREFLIVINRYKLQVTQRIELCAQATAPEKGLDNPQV